MMLKLILITLIGISFCACDADKEFDLDKSFNINYGDTHVNSSHRLKIEFEDVANDSRCPKGARCIWAGNAELKFKFSADTASEKIGLNTNIAPKDYKKFGYEITLKRLSPSKSTANPIEKEDYTATLVISKK
jgi:hypothetical protein